MERSSAKPPDCFSSSPTDLSAPVRSELDQLLQKLERPEQAKQIVTVFNEITDAGAPYAVKVVGSVVILTSSELSTMADWSFVDKTAAHRFAELIETFMQRQAA